MGNPPVHHPGAAAERQTPASANGILARIGGEYIARGSQQLPSAGPGLLQERLTIVVPDIPDLGAVRITYELNSYRHGRSRHWHWLAVHAALDEPSGS